MMKITISAVAVVAALAAAGCGGSTPGPPPGVIASPAPSASAAPHPASAAVLAADLRAEGLPVRHLIVYTAATDPNAELGRQGGYTSKVAWVDRRAVRAYQAGFKQDQLGFSPGNPGDRGSVDNGGGIEVFPTAAQARQRADYIRGFGAPLADGYDYADGGALLRLSQYLTPAQAQAYRADFTAAVSAHS
jgi:hypothetical protein